MKKCNACGNMVADELIANINEVNTGGDTICVVCHCECCPEDDRILRVEGGERGTEDHDTGRITAIDGDQVTVAWDSLVETTQHVSTVSRIAGKVRAITRQQVDLCQGQDDQAREFGYVSGEDGGFFFTWLPTLDETLDSLDEDAQDGDGGLDESEVREFLADYLPTTGRGQRLWGGDDA